jgi:hypothetical protein
VPTLYRIGVRAGSNKQYGLDKIMPPINCTTYSIAIYVSFGA